MPPTYGSVLRLADNFTYIAHRTLLPGQSLAREYSRADLSSFPAVGTIDPAVFDVLHSVAGTCHADPMFEVISGFRSAASNEMLREQGGGVARKSLHLKGMAIDVRLRGVACTHLRDVGLELARGGVGYYRKSDFVHLDTGRVRSWAG